MQQRKGHSLMCHLHVISLQVYLHDQDDAPQIKNLGFAVSPGVHALVAAKYNTVGRNIYILHRAI